MGKTEESFARTGIEQLLDEKSFVELGAFVTARSTDINSTPRKELSDGVISGYGLIHEHLVYIYAQDSSVLNGTLGEMHCRKIAQVYEKAAKVGAPVIGLLDSAGFRLQESMDGLEGFGLILNQMQRASGRAPLFTIITGNCGGGLAAIPAISDFSYMIETKGRLFVNSPNTIPDNYQEKNDQGKADFQYSYSGIIDCVGGYEEIVQKVRNLIQIIPGDWEEETETNDDLNRKIVEYTNDTYDANNLVCQIADDGIVCETKEGYAKDIFTGFIKLGEIPVGVVANREENKSSRITAEGLSKATDFVTFCDAFDLPILTITDTEGFMPSMKEERQLAKEMAKFSMALMKSDVPKINLIPRKAYGSAYVLMNSKGIGADVCIGWKDAKIGAISEDLGKKVVDCELSDDIQVAASRGYVDLVIEPTETRKYLIANFDMLSSKTDDMWDKKHTTK